MVDPGAEALKVSVGHGRFLSSEYQVASTESTTAAFSRYSVLGTRYSVLGTYLSSLKYKIPSGGKVSLSENGRPW